MTSLIHKMWRALPRDMRRRALYGGIDLVAPRATPVSRLRPGPVVVAGLLSTASGLGEGARLCFDALNALGWDPQCADLSPYFLRPDLPGAVQGIAANPRDGGTLLLHINGPYTPYAALRLGRAFMAGRKVIGHWNWELPRMGPDWSRGLRHVHEVWVSSRFIADAMPPDTKVPVRIVPYAVKPPATGARRDRFGIPDNAFVVLTAFDMSSSYVRKNPRAAIAAFRRAFGDDPNCLLVLKVGNAGDAHWAMNDLTEAIAGMSNVRLLQETLTRDDISALTASADVVLSLHRSEGFGLLLAEAMLLGIPAIATGWSGNVDFMTPADSVLIDYKLVAVDDPQGTYTLPGTSWADADVEQAAAWLTRLRDDGGLRKDLGERGRAAASKRLSVEAYGRAVENALPARGTK
jgi:glycosyltransferase involved in cell wall biosynthesis